MAYLLWENVYSKYKKEGNTLLQQTHPVRGLFHQMFDVKNEISFAAKQQISVKQKF